MSKIHLDTNVKTVLNNISDDHMLRYQPIRFIHAPDFVVELKINAPEDGWTVNCIESLAIPEHLRAYLGGFYLGEMFIGYLR